MKRLLIAVVAVCLAGSAAASSIDFTFGTNFYTPAAAEDETANMTNFTVAWNLDNDITLGAYSEAGIVATDDVSIAAIQVKKGVLKRVKVGLNLGSMDADTTEALVDIFGQVTILSGSGDNITGELVAIAAARFTEAELDSGNTGEGHSIGLGVLIGF